MNKFIPSAEQWNKWSLPSKLTAIGVLLTILFFAISYFFPLNSPSDSQQNVWNSNSINIGGNNSGTIIQSDKPDATMVALNQQQAIVMSTAVFLTQQSIMIQEQQLAFQAEIATAQSDNQIPAAKVTELAQGLVNAEATQVALREETIQVKATLAAISSTTADKNRQITNIAFSPDNKFIATSTACGIVSILGLQPESATVFRLEETKQDTLIQFANPPHMLAFTSDSKLLAISSRGDSLDKTCRRTILVSPDDKGVLSSPKFTAVTGMKAKPLIGFQNWLWLIPENAVSFWGFVSGPIAIPVGYEFIGGADFAVQRDSDSALLFQRSDNHSYAWEMDTSEAVRSMSYEELDSINATTAFNPDATIKAVANGKNIDLERTTDNQVWHVLEGGSEGGHQSTVTAIAFSRDGKTLVSASEDGEVIIWDIDRVVTKYFPDAPPADMSPIFRKFSTYPGITSLELSYGDIILAIGFSNGSIGAGSISGLIRR